MLRQLVAGQGCTEDAGPSTSSTSNPLAGWFSQLLGSSKQNEYLPEVRLPTPTFSKVDREKIRNRSHIHTRHLFPDAPPEVLEQQLQAFLRSLNISDPTSKADDPKYFEFLSGEPHQAASEAHINWASEYQRHQPAHDQNRQSPHHPLPEQQAHEQAWSAARPASRPLPQPHQLPPTATQDSDWADAFHQSRNAASESWAEDFSRLQLPVEQPAPAHPSTPWVAEFQARQQQPQPTDQPWAEQFLADDDQQWAEQFATEEQEQAQQRQLTLEEQKALRGAQPDDPLDDKTALSWVRQFNEEAAKPTVNFGNFSDLSSEMQLVPEPENPFAHHPAPLQVGRQLQATGRSQDAALAFQAAARLAPSNPEVWMRLGSCRFQLEQFSAAVKPLRRAAQLLTPDGAPQGGAHLQDTLWLLIQACSGAGKKEEAVRGMEQLCEVKAEAAGPSVVHTVQAAGISLEARLQALSRALPGDAGVYLLLGMMRNAKGNKEEAANAYAAAVRISLDAPMLTELARALRALGKHAEAQRCCTAAVTARPDYATGWLELGRAQAAQGGFTDACQSYMKALETRDQPASAWDSLSMALIAKGQLHLAELADKHDLAALKALKFL